MQEFVYSALHTNAMCKLKGACRVNVYVTTKMDSFGCRATMTPFTS